MTPLEVNSLGLLLDIVGVLLIWKYGLGQPLEVKNSAGKVFNIALGSQSKFTLNKIMDRMGLILLVVGFSLQLVSNYMK